VVLHLISWRPGGLRIMTYPCAGIILSGGLNTRMGGENKAFLSVGGDTIINRLYTLFTRLFDEILLVTNEPLDYLDWDMMIVTDVFPIRSSLTGIHAGLMHASTPHVFVTACDTPFLKEALIRILLDELEPEWDVIMPVTENGNQPLCAIYSKRCVKLIERQLENEDLKILNFFSKAKVKTITEPQIRSVDPHLTSFFNINAPEDLAASEKLLADGLV
jgi:molybdopterin-guanine dinucleotide biosynthesis protein A